MKAQKNNTLELLKLFASYMVVFIHVSFYGDAGIAMNALARFAVPFFFLTSGYYSYQISCEKIKKRIGNILTLLVISTVCCTIFEVALLLKYNMGELIAVFDKYTELSTYIDLLIFNMPVLSGHLWYLLAILYVYIIFYFVTKFNIKEKVIFAISLPLLLLHILLGEGLSIFGIVLPIQFVRNFALMGIPFFALGLLVKKHENKFQNVPNYIILIFAVLGVLESIASRFILGENELQIGSLLILFATVCITIKYANVKYPSFVTALDGCSTYIYIFHRMISSAFFVFYGIVGIDIYSCVALENLHPVIVCIAATVFSYILIRILKKSAKRKIS